MKNIKTLLLTVLCTAMFSAKSEAFCIPWVCQFAADPGPVSIDAGNISTTISGVSTGYLPESVNSEVNNQATKAKQESVSKSGNVSSVPVKDFSLPVGATTTMDPLQFALKGNSETPFSKVDLKDVAAGMKPKEYTEAIIDRFFVRMDDSEAALQSVITLRNRFILASALNALSYAYDVKERMKNMPTIIEEISAFANNPSQSDEDLTDAMKANISVDLLRLDLAKTLNLLTAEVAKLEAVNSINVSSDYIVLKEKMDAYLGR